MKAAIMAAALASLPAAAAGADALVAPIEAAAAPATPVIAEPVVAAPARAASTAKAAAGAGSRPSHPAGPDLKSKVALVFDEAQRMILYAKNTDEVVPIASITKLMTAMVVLDAGLPMAEAIRIERADVDRMKNSRSRLDVGVRVRRDDLLRVSLMASDNRAAAALARSYPGGVAACVAAMNLKAAEIGMLNTRFADPTGLSSRNVSSAQDLALLVQAAGRYPEIREGTTSTYHAVRLSNRRVLEYHNSNGLLNNKTWTIGLSKTGYINEAGRCLVMQAEIAARPVIIVLLDSWGKYTRLGDANRIRKWMETTFAPRDTARAMSPGQRESGQGR